mmetsp:Transcript_25715/g.54930  ORF Transcript_25715/g.54930 Transcript_25715/m.54930 type:complete len:318 (-) Transcript_25715:119-1072(-)
MVCSKSTPAHASIRGSTVSMPSSVNAILALAAALLLNTCEAFDSSSSLSLASSSNRPHHHHGSSFARTTSKLFLQKGWFDNDHEEDGDSDELSPLVTREDVHRDLLGMEPTVKRKRKNGKGGTQGYKPLDNRDHLPFSVRTKTPDDPYKTEFQKKRQQQQQQQRQTTENGGGTRTTASGGGATTTDLDRHMLAATRRGGNGRNKKAPATTKSRLVSKTNKGKSGSSSSTSTTTVLGEFELDKSTTSGDIIVVGTNEYLVEKARCQYKYAGGQRFVMVRKILEVKEIHRAKTEDVLLRRYNLDSTSSADVEQLNELEK